MVKIRKRNEEYRNDPENKEKIRKRIEECYNDPEVKAKQALAYATLCPCGSGSKKIWMFHHNMF